MEEQNARSVGVDVKRDGNKFNVTVGRISQQSNSFAEFVSAAFVQIPDILRFCRVVAFCVCVCVCVVILILFLAGVSFHKYLSPPHNPPPPPATPCAHNGHDGG